MDFNRNLRIVRTSGSSYPFPYKSNVLWVHHDENNNPVVEIWDHGKWVPVTGVRSGSDDVIIDTEMSDSSSNAIANKTVKKYVDGIASKTDASILSLNEGMAALQSLIDTLNSDSNVDGSVSKTVADAVAGVVAGAPEDLDTLKEIADYIASDNRVVAEAIVSLAARLDALEGSRGILGDATAGTVDVRGLTKCRYPLVMLAHGVPAESNVPDNIPDGLPWDGVPVFIGQLYINLDATSGGLYYATGHNSVADWKQA